MSDVQIPTLRKYGKEIGKAADAGDKKAAEIIRWYSSSQQIGDMHGICLAELMAEKWVKERDALKTKLAQRIDLSELNEAYLTIDRLNDKIEELSEQRDEWIAAHAKAIEDFTAASQLVSELKAKLEGEG